MTVSYTHLNEVIVATSDTVLFLGCLSDIDFTGEKIT